MQNVLRFTILLLLVGCPMCVSAQSPGSPPRDVLFDCPDPAVIQPNAAGPVYVFATGRGIPIYRSDDLYRWNRIGRVYDQGLPAWAKTAVPGATAIWAPDISRFNGLYHLYYAVSTFGSQHSAIGLAVNKSLDPASPDYRWEDRGMVLESAPGKTDFNAIDPAMIVDRDNRPYLFWGSFWSGLNAAPLDPATGKLPTGAKFTAVAARAPGIDPPSIEAPYVFEHGGYWYLFVSWGNCCDGARSTYEVVVGRSKAIMGPYVDRNGRAMAEGGGTSVLASHGKWCGPGHNSALSTPQGDWMVNAGFHADHLRRGRVLQIRPMTWSDDGWPIIGETVSAPVQLGRKVQPHPTTERQPRKWPDTTVVGE